jgi:hypothetical protein
MKNPFCPNPECFKKSDSGPYECELTQTTHTRPNRVIDPGIINNFFYEVVAAGISFATSNFTYEIYQCRACATQVVIGHAEDENGRIRKILGNNLK